MAGHRRILIVGAGFAGAVYARTLVEAGHSVIVIDKRDHIAGNAYDYVGADGVRIHRYGPHLFHTANRSVLDWIKRFGDWLPYTHKVRALLPCQKLAALPINLSTLNVVFGLDLKDGQEAAAHLDRIACKIDRPANAAEYLASKIGVELRDLFFRPYTKKMWGHDLEDLSAAIVKRIPLRTDCYDSYFREHETQVLPKLGYTNFVASILRHPAIEVRLNTPFERSWLDEASYCFSSMAIDEFYDFCEGPLPYRSLRFHHRSINASSMQPPWSDADENFSVVNFTDAGPFTRETAWHRLPCHIVSETGRRTITCEEPCDYTENSLERYYPVNDAEGQNLETYMRYERLAAADSARISFIGRCGTYRYLDMDQTISQSVAGAHAWLRRSQKTDVSLDAPMR